MTDNTQPEALDLADWLEAVGGGPSAKRCSALLREQHARIAELEAQLEAIGAGGVEPLRSRRCLHQIAEPGVAPEHALKAMTLEQATGGMTLRDYFAAQALPAVYRDLWDDVRAGRHGSVPEEWRMGVALDAYALADAMLRARTTQGASHVD